MRLFLSLFSHQSVHRWHPDDECEEVVDDRVETTVAQEPPREMRHALKLVVDVQLRCHQDEPERVHERLVSRARLGVFVDWFWVVWAGCVARHEHAVLSSGMLHASILSCDYKRVDE